MDVFEKIAYEQFESDMRKVFTGQDAGEIRVAYDSVCAPQSVGEDEAVYLLSIPFNLTLLGGDSVCVPTGIRLTESHAEPQISPPEGMEELLIVRMAEPRGEGLIIRVTNSGGKRLGFNRGDCFARLRLSAGSDSAALRADG